MGGADCLVIPRISHDFRPTAAFRGIWLHVPEACQGRRNALNWGFGWWQVLGSNQRRPGCSYPAYVPRCGSMRVNSWVAVARSNFLDRLTTCGELRGVIGVGRRHPE
jgi:hypothetical protein